jgi:hypothetical protein
MLVTTLKSIAGKIVLASGVLAAAAFAMPRPASADTASTLAIVAAAAAIVGAIAYDNSGRPYYVRDGRRWYVAPAVADYYSRYRYDGRGDRWTQRDRNGDSYRHHGGHGRPPHA